MAVIVLVSAAASPGVTATGVGLSLMWPTDVLLVDADPHPTQAVLAGYLRGSHSGGAGLPELARAAREGRPLAPRLLGESLPLAEGSTRRLFLPGFSNPGAATLFGPLWPQLADALTEHSRAGLTCLVDAGRIATEGPLAGLLSAADAVLVATRSHLPALAALRIYLPVLQDLTQRFQSNAQVGLLVVGPDRPYRVPEVESQFGLPAWAALPYDPAGAAVLAEGADEPRRFGDRPYVRGLREAASAIAARLQARRLRIQGVA